MSELDSPRMIEAPVTASAIRNAYDIWSAFYGSIVVPLERGPRLRGLELAAIQPQDKVLEVAPGTGPTLLEILRRVDRGNVVYGVDLSPKMLQKARRAAAKAGYTNIDLRQGDARSLPFDDNYFDVLVNSYMLDLIPLNDMPVVLGEFRRVLKNAGRLILVNMSKDRGMSLWERLYRATPKALVPYLYGGCRPVLMADLLRVAGFRDVQREFIRNIIPSEVVVGIK